MADHEEPEVRVRGGSWGRLGGRRDLPWWNGGSRSEADKGSDHPLRRRLLHPAEASTIGRRNDGFRLTTTVLDSAAIDAADLTVAIWQRCWIKSVIDELKIP